MEQQVIIFCDGACRGNPGLSSIGVYVSNPPKGGKPWEINGFLGKHTNNEAEYKAFIYALFLAKQQNWRNILIKCDSLLVVNQINGSWQIKNLNLMKLYEEAQYYLTHLTKEGKVDVVHIPREENKEADRLANLGLDKAIENGCTEEVAYI